MKNTLTIIIVLLFVCNQAKSQTYSQTFENTTMPILIDSGWLVSGVTIGNSNKLSGSKELITQLLNASTSTSTYITTSYFSGKSINTVQFQHVINNASGKSIDLVVEATDSANNLISTFTYTYNSASAVTSSISFTKNGRFKLNFAWSGAKTSSGSTAGLDMILTNRPLAPVVLVALPVTLNQFNVFSENDNIKLNWSTTSEENLSKFEVMRSFDGINFQSVGTATARGNSNELNEYQFSDINAAAFNQSKIFYQLRMIDENGDYKLSNMVQLRMSTIATVSVYPNPSSDYLNVNLSEAIDTDAAVSISDINGKNVELNSTSNNGTSIQFNIQQLENGVYFLNLLNNDGSVTATKFIKR
ncbi:MAG: T9SS type A sorting domain-containing protein [bacterium]|nr:T9SS type A sorting domain-containing protein [bacterium]